MWFEFLIMSFICNFICDQYYNGCDNQGRAQGILLGGPLCKKENVGRGKCKNNGILIFSICRGLFKILNFFQIWEGASAPRVLYLGPPPVTMIGVELYSILLRLVVWVSRMSPTYRFGVMVLRTGGLGLGNKQVAWEMTPMMYLWNIVLFYWFGRKFTWMSFETVGVVWGCQVSTESRYSTCFARLVEYSGQWRGKGCFYYFIPILESFLSTLGNKTIELSSQWDLNIWSHVAGLNHRSQVGVHLIKPKARSGVALSDHALWPLDWICSPKS